VRADISHPGGSKKLIQTVKEHSSDLRRAEEAFKIDVIVNNAGVASNAAIEDIEPEQFEWMYRVNVLGPLLLMQAALPYLPHDRTARVVNLSSISSTEGFIGQSVYGGSKAALEAMTRTWARELSSRGTVNAINPGPVKTDMWDTMPEEHKIGLKPWVMHTPMAAARDGTDDENVIRDSHVVGGRPAYTKEIAGIVGMLCMKDSAWCTGQVICANGGMRMAI
jgi:3-oxoacyl-[acyl-carrier protein] reductase